MIRRVLVFASLILLAAAALPAEETRTVRLEIDAVQPFAVENLVGTMKVKPGSSDKAVAVATLHAESAELLAAMSFERVSGEGGVPTLRVRYPLDRHRRVRAPLARRQGKHGAKSGSSSDSFLARLFGAGETTTEYDGKRVTVSDQEGVELYADVEVELPRRAVEARFHNHVGNLGVGAVEGRLQFEAASGDIVLSGSHGDLEAETGSGDIRAAEVAGRIKGSTGSGDCEVAGFDGEKAACETGSGDVGLRSLKAKDVVAETGSGEVKIESAEADRIDASTGSGEIELSAVSALRLKLETGSGDVRAQSTDVRELAVDTGSGDVLFESRSSRLERVSIDTGSGDVRLRLGASASFVARASQSSGEMKSGFADAQAILDGREVVGYRRGDGRARIDVSTGSGDVQIDE